MRNAEIRSILGVAVLAASLGLAAGTARAAPDIDGAVDALIDWPFSTMGDVVGSAGLLTSSAVGATGDIVALVDENEYGHLLLRGIFSSTIRRMGLGVSNLSTGALEGMRAEDLGNFPESAAGYLNPENFDGRVDAFMSGLGGVYVGVIDAVSGPFLFLLRAAGASQPADDLQGFGDRARDRYFGAPK